MSSYPKVPFDAGSYLQRTRDDARRGACFICSIVAGDLDDHLVIRRDDVCISFLAKSPTLLGYALLAPLEHRTDVVGDFTEDEYLELQRRVHRLGRAISLAVPTERLYVLALGSHQGNAHVHWHVAPLPPGVPYEEQQYAALMHENGYLDIPNAEQSALARAIAGNLAADSAPEWTDHNDNDPGIALLELFAHLGESLRSGAGAVAKSTMCAVERIRCRFARDE